MVAVHRHMHEAGFLGFLHDIHSLGLVDFSAGPPRYRVVGGPVQLDACLDGQSARAIHHAARALGHGKSSRAFDDLAHVLIMQYLALIFERGLYRNNPCRGSGEKRRGGLRGLAPLLVGKLFPEVVELLRCIRP